MAAIPLLPVRAREPGITVLADGTPVSKCDPRLAAVGDIDETRCAVRLLAALLEAAGAAPLPMLGEVEQDLLAFEQELGSPGRGHVARDRVGALERFLRGPAAFAGAHRLAAAQARACRAVCRRAERTVVDLSESQVLAQDLQPYLDRLGDVMRVLAERLETAP